MLLNILMVVVVVFWFCMKSFLMGVSYLLSFLVFMVSFMDFRPIMCWNCRGVSGCDTISRIRRLLVKHKPLLCCLVETRADEVRLRRFCAKLGKEWEWAAVAANGYSGGIIVLWKRQVGCVTPMAISRFALHLVISDNSNSDWFVSVIYNDSRVSGQRRLWHELSGLSSLNLAWVIIGDFNSIVHGDEHKGGLFRYYACKARLFSNFIAVNGLLEVGYTGSAFTWCNNQSGLARRWARLDRCLVNSAWAANFDVYVTVHLPSICSDHAPLLLKMSARSVGKTIIFRFDNYWLDYLDCHGIVRNAWNFQPNSNPLHAFYHLVARCKKQLCLWRASGKSSLEKSLVNTELEINALELLDSASPANPEIHNSLVSLYNKFSALQRQSACKWAQWARLQWVQDGDHNTGFFHNCVRFRKHVNSISHILDANGNVCFGHQGIEQVFVDFYSKLWSESDPKNVSDVCFALPDDLISLSDCDADFLVKDVSKNEVFQTLISLPSGKSPGPDGLNVEFYRFFWDVVGDHLFDVVSHFFKTGSLPASWAGPMLLLFLRSLIPNVFLIFGLFLCAM